jgi:hypothetical protein
VTSAIRFNALLLGAALCAPASLQATVVTSGCGGAASDFGLGCSLAELDPASGPSGSITINDKIFENWFADRTSSTFGDSDFFRSAIRVDPIDDLVNPGLRLVDTSVAWNNVNEFSSDSVQFDVRVLSGEALIKDVALISEIGRIGAATPPSTVDGFVSLDYLVFDGLSVLGQVETICDSTSCEHTTLSSSIDFTPREAIRLSGSMAVIGGQAPGAGENAQLIAHTVLISQVAPVTEPGTIALLACGLLGWGSMRAAGRWSAARWLH